MAELSGRCFCGSATWRASGEPVRNLVCHCGDCRRATSSPFTAFVGLNPAAVAWSGPINDYESSPGSWHGFCPTCGARLYFRSGKWPGKIHIHAATLDDVHLYHPSAQVVLRARADWLDALREIPAHQGFQHDPEEH